MDFTKAKKFGSSTNFLFIQCRVFLEIFSEMLCLEVVPGKHKIRVQFCYI